MLSLDRINKILSRIKYKPGFKIKAMQAYYDIEIRFYQYGIPNALKPEEESSQPLISTMIITEECIDRVKNLESLIIERVRHQIITMELHEVDEWFKFDDVCVNNPHPEFKQSAVKLK